MRQIAGNACLGHVLVPMKAGSSARFSPLKGDPGPIAASFEERIGLSSSRRRDRGESRAVRRGRQS
jgi:hypothetical protein